MPESQLFPCTLSACAACHSPGAWARLRHQLDGIRVAGPRDRSMHGSWRAVSENFNKSEKEIPFDRKVIFTHLKLEGGFWGLAINQIKRSFCSTGFIFHIIMLSLSVFIVYDIHDTYIGTSRIIFCRMSEILFETLYLIKSMGLNFAPRKLKTHLLSI